MIYHAMLRAIKKGNPRVFAVLADRAYGKTTTHVEVEGETTWEALTQCIIEGRRRVVDGLTDAELTERIEELQGELMARSAGLEARRLTGLTEDGQ